MALSLADLTHCYYIPGTGRVIDAEHPNTCRGVYSGKSVEDMRDEYPDIVRGTFEDAAKIEDDHFRSPPIVCTEADFMEALECLPPMKWRHGDGAESFMISERTAGSITNIYCRIGDRYYTLADSVTLTHEQIVDKCKEDN